MSHITSLEVVWMMMRLLLTCSKHLEISLCRHSNDILHSIDDPQTHEDEVLAYLFITTIALHL